MWWHSNNTQKYLDHELQTHVRYVCVCVCWYPSLTVIHSFTHSLTHLFILLIYISYVRIRRKLQTFYVFCQPDVHGVDHLKQQVATALAGFSDDPVEMDDLKIMDTAGTDLEDLSKLENEQELHVVFRISDEEYEPVQVQHADMIQ